MMVYLIGSLRDPNIRTVATVLRDCGLEVFDDWHAAGEKADEEWTRYEKERGRTYWQALNGHAATHTFEYDLRHLRRAAFGVLVAPAGRSAHLELGYLLGQDKPGIIYMPEEPERWDVMVKFATHICQHINGLVACVEQVKSELKARERHEREPFVDPLYDPTQSLLGKPVEDPAMRDTRRILGIPPYGV